MALKQSLWELAVRRLNVEILEVKYCEINRNLKAIH